MESDVPASHTPDLQHPLQLPALQVVALLQVPLTHCWSPVHVSHACPLVPQADTELPPLHSLPSQQPTQVVGSHVELHAPSTHLSAPEQTLHWAPSLPQADCCAPDMHWSPWQHPVGQEAALQVHSPASHARPVPHSVHAPPVIPHSSAVLPFTHSPCSLQQPTQFEGPQFCVWVSHVALTHAWSAVHVAHAAPALPHAVWLVPS
jgi:hypothetical protein